MCPAGGLPALKAAVDNGADWVYLGLRDDTNARNFAGLNFDAAALAAGVVYAHTRGRKVLLAVNTYPQAQNWSRWTAAIDRAAAAGADAVIIADPALMRHAARAHPKLELHLSVQGSATSYEAINFFHERFGGRWVMGEGRCALSAYACGDSPNTSGACSPARAVRWKETAAGLESRLNGLLIDRYAAGERAAYPTLGKGRYTAEGECYYAFEEPASLNVLGMLPELMRIGVRAVKIEGRQRSPAYVAQVTRVWREAIDAVLRAGDRKS